MSAKINTKDIIIGHYKTLKDATDNKISLYDILTFFVVPILVSAAGVFYCFNLSKYVISLLVNFGAIFTALLLSVLVLVYDQECKIDTNTKDATSNNVIAKKDLLKQLYFNICYCIVASVFLILICLIHGVVDSISTAVLFNIYLTTPLIIFITSNIILTILMIVKRMHVLLVA